MTTLNLLVLALVLVIVVVNVLAIITSVLNGRAKKRRWAGLREQVRGDYGIEITDAMATADNGSTLDGDETYTLAVGDGRWLRVRAGETRAELILPQWAAAQR